MLNAKEMAWLKELQEDLAIRDDWVAVAHLQIVIDRIVDEHPRNLRGSGLGTLVSVLN